MFDATTLSIMTFSITTLSKMSLIVTLSINRIQHKVIKLSVAFYCYADCHWELCIPILGFIFNFHNLLVLPKALTKLTRQPSSKHNPKPIDLCLY
jgi:hypothetical protein